MGISEEKEVVTFYVIKKPKLEFVILKEFNLSNLFSLQLQQVYIIIFVAVGLNIVRGKMFNQTSMIWNVNIPEPDKVIAILDAIEFARFEQDFVK